MAKNALERGKINVVESLQQRLLFTRRSAKPELYGGQEMLHTLLMA